jgi:hypothetical protein
MVVWYGVGRAAAAAESGEKLLYAVQGCCVADRARQEEQLLPVAPTFSSLSLSSPALLLQSIYLFCGGF